MLPLWYECLLAFDVGWPMTAREFLEAADRAIREGCPVRALFFRNEAWLLDAEMAEAWPRWEKQCSIQS